MLEAKIDQTKSSIHKIHFVAQSLEPITMDQVREVQERLGFPPMGYGIYSLKMEYDPVLLRHKATWFCGASCD